MRVVDTSAWIEWIVASPLAETLRPEFPSRDRLVVPTIVQLELAKWLRRELNESAADNAIAYTMKCVVAPLDTTTALLAAQVSADLGLATADSIIYATALQHESDILTCDAHFAGLDRVIYFAKSG
ncbi:MAG: type II toxin-antitoxin system VapC family toxin [Nitratireductor sp.]